MIKAAVLFLSISAVFSQAIPNPPNPPSFLMSSDDERDHQPQIVGGQDVAGEFDFATRVVIVGSGGCTGALIHKRWVITAAHCFDRYSTAEDVYVCLNTDGCDDRRDWERSSYYEIRPGFQFDEAHTSERIKHDQALIRLRSSARDIVPPAMISPDHPTVRAGEIHGLGIAGVLAGWGYTRWEPGMDEWRRVEAKVLQKSPAWVREALENFITHFQTLKPST